MGVAIGYNKLCQKAKVVEQVVVVERAVPKEDQGPRASLKEEQVNR